MATDLIQLIRRVPRVVWFLVGLWWTARVWERIFNLQVGSTSGEGWPSLNSELASVVYDSLPVAMVLASLPREPALGLVLAILPLCLLGVSSDLWSTRALQYFATHPGSVFESAHRELLVVEAIIRPREIACWQAERHDCRHYAGSLLLAWAPAFAVWSALAGILNHHSARVWGTGRVRKRVALAAIAAAALVTYDRLVLVKKYLWAPHISYQVALAALGLVALAWLPTSPWRLPAAATLSAVAILPIGVWTDYAPSDLGPGLLHLPMGVLIMFTVWGILAPPPRPATTPADPSASR